MGKFLRVLLLLCQAKLFAFDKIQDMRYTNGIKGKSETGIEIESGARTSFDSDLAAPLLFRKSLGQSFEAGAKLLFESKIPNIDVGGKFFFSKSSLGADVWYSPEEENFAVVLSYWKRRVTAKNFSTDYEIRTAFGDAAALPGGICKLSGSVRPTLQFNEIFFFAVEITSSGSLAKINKDYKLDLIPQFNVKISPLTFHLEYNTAILLERTNPRNFMGMFVSYGF